MEFIKEVSTRQEQIARNAKNLPKTSFTSLAYHIDEKWLYVAYTKTRKNGAPGIDGITAKKYEEQLIDNLKQLKEKLKSGKYKAPPVKRGYVAKNEREQRPIGMPTYEDKIAQRSIQMAVEPIYEQDFYDFSYGFRPGRSPHMALNRLWNEIMNMGGAYIIDLDISKYFDTIDHKLLREILAKRVKDGVITRLIGKWLKAGVMEDMKYYRPEKGSPQGGVISPLLSNIYLHEVLDKWFVEKVKPRMKGRSAMVRFADDATLIFEDEEDMKRVQKVLSKRFAKYGLKLNEEKTKIQKFFPSNGKGKGLDSFTFLGFRHYWGKSRKGKHLVKRKTDAKRLTRAIKKVSEWCKKNRHREISEQQGILNMKLRGHYNYYGITPNIRSLVLFFENAKKVWMKWLNRRSRNRHLNWDKFNKLLRRYPLLRPKIYHSSA